ncbi:MAG TPA: Nramp family divalent metal transporter [Rhizomicrobium sp.]|jgi:NRAMP (natural resistance-associated macrophage protein)-like metal ion transporter
MSEKKFQLRHLARQLGPGVITGAADDDPSGIATYSQVGAQFGYTMSWVLVLTTPLMVAVQEISARLGRVTGEGLGAAMRRYIPRWLMVAILLSLVVANIFNLGADIGAMAAACKLLIGGPVQAYAVLIAVFCAACEIYLAYKRYVIILKWLTLALLTYVALLFVVHLPLKEVLAGAFLPQTAFTKDALIAIVAVLGTTISPYLFFWQASEEAEDEHAEADSRPLREHAEDAPAQTSRIRFDTIAGMIFSNAIALSIILGTAATLHATGHTTVNSAADAAEALKPIAGAFASVIFSIGIIGTGLLAVPVLAGSVAYAVGEAFSWTVGLSYRAFEARLFYGFIALATGVGAAITFSPLDPIKALFWSAVINGVVAAPMIALMVWLGSRKAVMGTLTLSWPLKILGLATAILMAACTAGMIFL